MRIVAARILFETLEANRLQIGRNRGIEQSPRSSRIGFQDLHETCRSRGFGPKTARAR